MQHVSNLQRERHKYFVSLETKDFHYGGIYGESKQVATLKSKLRRPEKS